MEARAQTDDPLVMLYVPCGGETEAKELATRLLDERLIACANLYASLSLYRWHGETAESKSKYWSVRPFRRARRLRPHAFSSFTATTYPAS